VIRFLPLILLGSSIVVASTLPKQPSGYRDNLNLCTEVTREINIQVYEGMLTPGQGKDIIDRCFELYVK